jgi:MYXO-CTERM domain-containing protein
LSTAAFLCALLAPSSALAGGAAVSASTGERVDVLHNTIASFSSEGSTVVEQVHWQGDGSVTLWVLAVPLDAELVLSSDALVSTFDQALAVSVRQPANSCFMPQVIRCGSTGVLGESVGGGVGGSSGTVFPVADLVAWPTDWAGPGDVADVDAFFAGFAVTPPEELMAAMQAAGSAGYGFVMLELPAGSGPMTSPAVRITSSQPSDVLPMLAPRPTAEIRLNLIGGDRFELAEHPTDIIEEQDLDWDWNALQSNYDAVAGEARDAGWLVEAGEPLSPYAFDSLHELVSLDPLNSGYPSQSDAVAAAQADAGALLNGLSIGSTWVTRLSTRVPAGGFELELALAPLDSLDIIDRELTPASESGLIPDCDSDVDCGMMPDDSDLMGSGSDENDGCSASPAGHGAGWLLAVLVLGLTTRRRRLLGG